LPQVLVEGLIDCETGERLQVQLPDGDTAAAFDHRNLFDIKSHQFDRAYSHRPGIEPQIGRFYPKGLLKGVNGVYRANVQPFRCVGINNGHITVDFNHPLAGKELKLSAVVGRVTHKVDERGGTSVDWMEKLLAGPGMQARWGKHHTDYFSENAFLRQDESPDPLFYNSHRLVSHIDETAREMVMNTYGRFLADGMQVLDLMSSWQSHMPANLKLRRLVGLGLNAIELKKNPDLTQFVVRDLNETPQLPFDNNTFDAIVNTVSVEYLTRPLAIFKEASRVLRPGGFFIVTFSNRWFPTKSVKIWTELHEFERMGLVLEFFLRAGDFEDLQTYSIRGLPRPHHDRYFPDLLFSDPVYAVWGRKA
jgi:SAM-dependent methyltransferase